LYNMYIFPRSSVAKKEHRTFFCSQTKSKQEKIYYRIRKNELSKQVAMAAWASSTYQKHQASYAAFRIFLIIQMAAP